MSICVQEKFGGTGSFFLFVWNRNKFDVFLNKYGTGNSFAGVNFLNDSILF